jgi:predicted RNase H-like HicB family nuclease
MKVRDLVRLIEADGWFLVRTTGSHRQFYTQLSPYRHDCWQLVRRGTTKNISKRIPPSADPERRIAIRYAVIFEKCATGYGAYVPDLSGCVATASTMDETRRLIREAMELHVADMRATGQSVPQPTSLCEYAKIDTL